MTIPWAQVFVDVPTELVPSTQRFWAIATGGAISAPWDGHPEFVTLRPTTGMPYVHVQEIGGPPRVHVDLTSDDIDREVARLTALGAEPTERFAWWYSMRSPAGLPFCVCADPARVRPGAVTWPGGHRSRVSQVCLDIPAAAYNDEWEFWQRATGWQRRHSRRPEFQWLVPPPSSPVQFLLQRLGEADPRTTTTAHVDLGTDDIPAEVARLLTAGARDVGQPTDEGRWHILEDPAGLPFCVTPQPPD